MANTLITVGDIVKEFFDTEIKRKRMALGEWTEKHNELIKRALDYYQTNGHYDEVEKILNERPQ